ncbi:hypothetical protein ACWTU6_08585 [Mesorhizobium sp. BHbsci]
MSPTERGVRALATFEWPIIEPDSIGFPVLDAKDLPFVLSRRAASHDPEPTYKHSG